MGPSARRSAATPALWVALLVIGWVTGAKRADAQAVSTPMPRFHDVRVATGVRLRYAEQGDRAGEPIILLHGYSDSWFSFSRVLPLLPVGYHVYALDQRGHGDSERPEDGYTMRELAADVLAFMDAMELPRATVVGHSMGSFVAQQVALAAPARVTRLVLVSTTTTPRAIVGIHELEEAVNALNDPVSTDFVREFQYSTVFRPVPDPFMEEAIAGSLRLPARVWRALMAGMLATDVAAGLGEHGIPTLLMWGDRDTAFPRSEQEVLLVIWPSAELRVFQETGHAPHWEWPEEFARDLVAFMSAPARGAG